MHVNFIKGTICITNDDGFSNSLWRECCYSEGNCKPQMSEKYLEQVTAALSRAGYLKSTRGAKGGYRLANKPEEYTVGMILQTIEGSLAPVDMPEEESEGVLQLVDCVINEVWDQLGEAIDDVVDHITLADLIKNYNERIGYVYSI